MNTNQGAIAVVDDDDDILLSARMTLSKNFDGVVAFPHPDKLLELEEDQKFAAILLDMNYSVGKHTGEEGIDYLRKIKAKWPQVELVVMTAFADLDLAVKAVKAGAYDFVTKPWQNQKLMVTLNNAVQVGRQKQELKHQQVLLDSYAQNLPPLIGESEIFHQVLEQIPELAESNFPVVLSGGPGSGKQLVARHIHKLSKLSKESFVVVDSSEIRSQKEIVSNGSIYLEQPSETDLMDLGDIETLPYRLYVSGDQNSISILEKFNPQSISLPNLSEREEDCLEIAYYYLEVLGRKYQKQNLKLSGPTMDLIRNYSWPGNVQELKRILELAVFGSQNNTIELADYMPHNTANQPTSLKLEDLEKLHIEKVLTSNAGNISKSANELGLTRAALYRRIEKFEIQT